MRYKITTPGRPTRPLLSLPVVAGGSPAAADLAWAPDPELIVPLHDRIFAGIEADAAAFGEACGSLGATQRG